MPKVCICGTVFNPTRKSNRFCSRNCYNKNRPLRGFKKRQEKICFCGKQFWLYESSKKGNSDWGIYCSKKCKAKYSNSQFKKGHISYSKPIDFSESEMNYSRLHNWVNRVKKKSGECEFCGKKNCRLEWANKSRAYKKDINDWIELCVMCHRNYDKGAHGASILKFPERKINNKNATTQ